MARLMMRCRETLQSADYVLRLLDACDPAAPLPSPDYAPAARPDALAFGLVEGWRGEICHVTLTDAQENPARIMFCVSRDDLYRIRVQRDELDHFLRTLLRLI